MQYATLEEAYPNYNVKKQCKKIIIIRATIISLPIKHKLIKTNPKISNKIIKIIKTIPTTNLKFL